MLRILAINQVFMFNRFFIARFTRYAFVTALASACSEPVVGPRAVVPAIATLAVQQASGTADISGEWTYHEDATLVIFDLGGHASKPFRCSSDGTYTFAQNGDAFTGTFDQVGVCTAADGSSFPNNFNDNVVTGTIQGRHLNFTDDVGCTFEGTVRGPTSTALGGSVRCGGGGIFGTYRANWSATR